MAGTLALLDAHEAPPARLKETFKKYQKTKLDELDSDPTVLDFDKAQLPQEIEVLEPVNAAQLRSIFNRFMAGDGSNFSEIKDSPVYGHKGLSGLLILPTLLPPSVQKTLLSRLLHRDLSNPRHNTNLHSHYEIPYPEHPPEWRDTTESVGSFTNDKDSFFSYQPLSEAVFKPKDPSIHRPQSISTVMQKALRWITLGGQYDWTNKVYPEGKTPPFPSDISNLLEGLFPEMKAQAAIVNIYSPGDTLSLHRDVSEKSERGLVSISLGCECLFVIGHGESSDSLVIRLRSGDALFMSANARFAWHGVPRILPESCPSYLEHWPADLGQYEDWRNWMRSKRINLNVRQMHDSNSFP